jgi:hypothetical protein
MLSPRHKFKPSKQQQMEMWHRSSSTHGSPPEIPSLIAIARHLDSFFLHKIHPDYPLFQISEHPHLARTLASLFLSGVGFAAAGGGTIDMAFQ